MLMAAIPFGTSSKKRTTRSVASSVSACAAASAGVSVTATPGSADAGISARKAACELGCDGFGRRKIGSVDREQRLGGVRDGIVLQTAGGGNEPDGELLHQRVQHAAKQKIGVGAALVDLLPGAAADQAGEQKAGRRAARRALSSGRWRRWRSRRRRS